MLVKICAVNSKFIHSNPAVYSLVCYYRNLCRKANINYIDIEAHEYTVNDVYKNVLLSILAGNPKIIAFSVYIWNINFISKLCGDIKKIFPLSKIILGGPEVSFGVLPDENIYDYVIIGEGERAFFCLINEMQGNDISDYKEKFGYKTNGKKINCTEIENFSEIPFIYSQTDIGLFRNRIIYYESSRGCPFTCTYCLSSGDGKIRYQPLERVYNEIDFFLTEKNIRQVKFVDRTFNSNKNRAYEIFKYIINNTVCENNDYERSINFHFEICADLLDENIINLLSKAERGLIQFEIGIQTTTKETLEACTRKTDIKKCFDNIKLLLKNNNINIHVDLIAGLPKETFDSFKYAFNQVYSLNAHKFQLGFLKLLKGAPINSQIEQYAYKFSEYPPYEILTNSDMSYDDLAILNRIEIVLEKFYNSGKINSSLSYLINNHDCFKTPFDFYLCFSNYLIQRNMLYSSLSLDNLYNILIDFAFNKKINIVYLKEMLLLDYHSGDIYDTPPKAVRDIWEPYKNYRTAAIHENANLTARKIGQEYYFFEYNKKNPVTGRYEYLTRKK